MMKFDGNNIPNGHLENNAKENKKETLNLKNLKKKLNHNKFENNTSVTDIMFVSNFNSFCDNSLLSIALEPSHDDFCESDYVISDCNQVTTITTSFLSSTIVTTTTTKFLTNHSTQNSESNITFLLSPQTHTNHNVSSQKLFHPQLDWEKKVIYNHVNNDKISKPKVFKENVQLSSGSTTQNNRKGRFVVVKSNTNLRDWEFKQHDYETNLTDISKDPESMNNNNLKHSDIKTSNPSSKSFFKMSTPPIFSSSDFSYFYPKTDNLDFQNPNELSSFYKGHKKKLGKFCSQTDTINFENEVFKTIPQSPKLNIVEAFNFQSMDTYADEVARQGRQYASRQTARIMTKEGNYSVVTKNLPSFKFGYLRDLFTTMLDLRWRFNFFIFITTFVSSWFVFAFFWWCICYFHGDCNSFVAFFHEHMPQKNETEILDLLSKSFLNHSKMESNSSTSKNLTTISLNFNSSLFFFSNSSNKISESYKNLIYPNLSNFSSITRSFSHKKCMEGVEDFVSALLFSIETQQTIGYGTRHINSSCPLAVSLFVLQACFGILLQSIMMGVIFSKVSRPKHRTHTILFSKFAVLCLRDEEYCLQFRVGDMRKSHLIGTSIKVLLMKNPNDNHKRSRTKSFSEESSNNDSEEESSEYQLLQHNIDLDLSYHDNSVFLIWPVTIAHRITPDSPLWDLTMEELFSANFELVAVCQGTIEHTGMTAHFCTSYLPSEILWGHKLAPLVTYKNRWGKFEIDLERFHDVVPIKLMPDFSAKDYTHKKVAKKKKEQNNPVEFETVIKKQSTKRKWSKVLKRLKSKEYSKEEIPSDSTLTGSKIDDSKRNSVSGTITRFLHKNKFYTDVSFLKSAFVKNVKQK